MQMYFFAISNEVESNSSSRSQSLTLRTNRCELLNSCVLLKKQDSGQENSSCESFETCDVFFLLL